MRIQENYVSFAQQDSFTEWGKIFAKKYFIEQDYRVALIHEINLAQQNSFTEWGKIFAKKYFIEQSCGNN
jgi:hypothetical protein